MLNPTVFSDPWHMEPGNAEFCMFANECDHNAARESIINVIISEFKAIKARGEDPNDYIDQILEEMGIDDITDAEAKYIMYEVDRY